MPTQIAPLPDEFRLARKYFIENILPLLNTTINIEGKDYTLILDTSMNNFNEYNFFTHLISIEPKPRYIKFHPCTFKPYTISDCLTKCEFNEYNVFKDERVQCINRASKLKNINKVLSILISNPKIVQVWENNKKIFLYVSRIIKPILIMF